MCSAMFITNGLLMLLVRGSILECALIGVDVIVQVIVRRGRSQGVPKWYTVCMRETQVYIMHVNSYNLLLSLNMVARYGCGRI